MRKLSAALFVAVGALAGGAELVAAPPPVRAAIPEVAAGQIPSLAPVLREVTPGVVNIGVKAKARNVENPLLNDPFFRRFFNLPPQQRERETQATGSGVIVDAAQGYVLTNNHVVEDADQIEVTTKDNRRFRAKLIGRDPDTDVAVLKIEGKGLTALQFGDSDRLEVGDFVLAIGNPFGLGQTVTSGIVSALGRSGLGIEGYEDFIQTDASINPGNSGGALVDLRGRLVGLNTAILAPGGGNIGIGFAVPINMAKSVMDQLTRYGEVKRGRIGIGIQELTPEIAQGMGLKRSDGAVIAKVEPSSSAERAGLRPGDVVLTVDGIPIKSATQLRNRIGLTRVGETVEMQIERKGEPRTVRAQIDQVEGGGERPPRQPRADRQRR
jgi:serine protease Do/serine protease DegQ